MSRLAIACLLSSLAFVAALTPVHAEDPVVLDMQIEAPDQVTAGDRVTYVVTLEADERTQFTLVQASLPPIVEVVGSPQTSTRSAGDGRIEVTLTFTLAVFYVGDIPMSPMSLRWVNGDATGTIDTPASRLLVQSVLPSGGQVEPRDLKPQAVIGVGTPAWVAPAISAASVGLLAVATLLFWRLRNARRPLLLAPEPVAAEIGAEDSARLVLDKAGAAFGADADYVAYYRTIGTTVRNYLSQRYGFPAFALTTTELEYAMLRRGLDRWQVRVASGLLTQCDSVVYAHYRPAMERADADLTAAYEIVEMSRPVEQEPVGAAP
jgi:hypothetical protein